MTEAEKIPSTLDASMQKVGEAYARALLAVGQTSGKADEYVQLLVQLEEVLQQNPGLREVMVAPKVDVARKDAVLEKVLAGVDRPFLNFARLLARKGRFGCFPAIVASALAIQDAAAGRVQALVTTASEMNDESKNKLESRLSEMLSRQVTISRRVDAAMIGGIIVRVGDTVYDASVRNRLQQVKSKAIQGVSDAIRQSMERFATEV